MPAAGHNDHTEALFLLKASMIGAFFFSVYVVFFSPLNHRPVNKAEPAVFEGDSNSEVC